MCRFLFLFYFSFVAQAFSSVVVTLPPLKSLIQFLCKDICEVSSLDLLSPHTSNLKPKDFYLLKKAHLIIWVGPSYEHHLGLEQKGYGDRLLTLSCFIQEKPVRFSRHQEKDGHWWLSPRYMAKCLPFIAKSLTRLYPNHVSQIQKNLQKLLKDLSKLDQKVGQILKPVQGRPYVGFHDFTQYIDLSYGTRCTNSILEEPDEPLRPSHVQKLKKLSSSILISDVPSHPLLRKTKTFFFVDYLGRDQSSYEGVVLGLVQRLRGILG